MGPVTNPLASYVVPIWQAPASTSRKTKTRPAAKAKEKEFLSCQCQSNSETTNWPKAENLGQIER